MSRLDDYYEAETFNNERNGIPAPVALVGLSRMIAWAEADEAEREAEEADEA